MAPAAAAKDRGGIAIIAIRILHKRESSPLLQGLLCNGYRTIQIAQFKLKKMNKKTINGYCILIASDIAIQCLLLLSNKDPDIELRELRTLNYKSHRLRNSMSNYF